MSQTSLLKQYQRFCTNPLRGDNQIALEYDALIRHPRICYVGFYRPDVLLVGTDEIIIKHEGERLIGEFIIFFMRKSVNGYWEVDFRLDNPTRPLVITDEESGVSSTYLHPHIFTATDQVLDCRNGKLCISRGQFGLYQYIRKGEIHLAAPRLIEILETYPSGHPYRDADYWPEKGAADA